MDGLSSIFVFALATAGAVSVQSVTSTASTCSATPVNDLRYAAIDGVDPALLSVDISPVAGDCAAPVAVWVHGGGWRVGDKDNDAEARAAFYNAQGWVLVSVNYRLAVPGVEPAVMYPDFNDDVGAALWWIDDHVAEFGGDPERVLLVGHSAGAGIAAAVIADPGYLAPHDLAPDHIDCAVLLDSEGYDVAAIAVRDGQQGEIYRNAFGDDPLVWAGASPSSHVGEGPLPAAVVVVTRGAPRRVAAATAFGEQLRQSGVAVTIADVSPLSHADVNRLIGTEDVVMTPLLVETLSRCASTGPE